MSTLHDRLADLADEAGHADGAPLGHDLWVQGRRWQRRRRVGAVAVAGVLAAALIALGGVSWQVGQPEELRPAGSPAGLPDRVWLPSAALRSLAPRQRAVIVLRYYEDLTERQTADALGISIGTVKSQARDGLGRLRALVPDLDGDRLPA
jgi:DNA-directed RNA polymerase specialized sigma24 family protein